ncbi:hypothetical protein EDB86DRAFT_2946297 [Lactarius hatsudake]|nr:hypothetical protein EDB86DRAFT_2946297 [Lactarius hatsudake]
MAGADLGRVEPQNLRRKSTAAIEWRTIPPTIKVRHKKRPPPITIHSKRSFEQLVWTPGPHSSSTAATTATTASSATLFTPLTSSAPRSILVRGSPESAGAGQEPRTLYYAIPGFQQSPNGPDDIKVPPWPLSAGNFALSPRVGKTALDAVSELDHIHPGNEIPSPPPSPLVYLTLRPWTLPEYLLLLSVIPLCSEEEEADWEEVARKLNAAAINYQPRSAWDCWHRWAVSWCRPQRQAEPRSNTYPCAPGVQHESDFLDLEGLINLWTTLTSALGGHGSPSPLVFPGSTIAMAQTRHLTGRTHHPGAHPARFNIPRRFLTSDAAYPRPSAAPNVPARSLGDIRDRGLAAWFTMSVVNTSVLHRVLESQPERTDDWYPVHLRGRMVPPPPYMATSDPR